MLRRPDRFLLVGGLLILLQLGFRAWALWGSWFYFDDLAFMSRAMNQPFDVAYLTESYGGHLMPAGFALAWVLTKWWVYDWAPWAVTLLVLRLVASIGMFRLLVAMFGRFLLNLILSIVYPIDTTLPAAEQLAAYQAHAFLQRLLPPTLYTEASAAILNPAVTQTSVPSTLGQIDQAQQQIPTLLSFDQSLLLVWPHVVAMVAVGLLLLRWSRRRGWGQRHVLAAAGSALVVRASLSFLVEPLGDQ